MKPILCSKSLRRVSIALLSGGLLVGVAAGSVSHDESGVVSSREAPSTPVAVTEDESEILRSLIDSVGVDALLDSAASNFITELGDGCDIISARRQRELFQAVTLRAAFAEALAGRLDRAALDAVSSWYTSDAGRHAAALEAASAHLTETQVSEQLAELRKQADWADRLAAVKALLEAIRAAHFVTAFNVELDAALAVAADCERSVASRAEAVQAHASARADEGFVALIIGIELLTPSLVIYAALDDAQLSAYTRFATSAAGARWHVALEGALRETFEAQRDAMLEI